jgi:hypothetical protein
MRHSKSKLLNATQIALLRFLMLSAMQSVPMPLLLHSMS